MEQNNKKAMRTIWGAVGAILLVMGIVILLTGLYIMIFHVPKKTALVNLHPDIWWGSVMIIVGAIFFIINIRRK